jgi:hypothetical protein
MLFIRLPDRCLMPIARHPEKLKREGTSAPPPPFYAKSGTINTAALPALHSPHSRAAPLRSGLFRYPPSLSKSIKKVKFVLRSGLSNLPNGCCSEISVSGQYYLIEPKD